MAALVFSTDRVDRLRKVIWVDVVVGLVVAAYAADAWVRTGSDDPDWASVALMLTLIGLLLLSTAAVALWLLPSRDRRAKAVAIVLGIGLVVLSIPVMQMWFGFVMAMAGLMTLLLATMRDEVGA